jgi:hypothetical protein
MSNSSDDSSGSMPSATETKAQTKKGLREFFQQPSSSGSLQSQKPYFRPLAEQATSTDSARSMLGFTVQEHLYRTKKDFYL